MSDPSRPRYRRSDPLAALLGHQWSALSALASASQPQRHDPCTGLARARGGGASTLQNEENVPRSVMNALQAPCTAGQTSHATKQPSD
eukprot:2530524-Alexandrium_andersonii.AAC.1